jgi:hypothetical protein
VDRRHVERESSLEILKMIDCDGGEYTHQRDGIPRPDDPYIPFVVRYIIA